MRTILPDSFPIRLEINKEKNVMWTIYADKCQVARPKKQAKNKSK